MLSDMLTIGRFADATGLTVKALRHYDHIGPLTPAHVDAQSGYRYYDTAQIEEAVAIRRLRALEMPLDEVRQLLRPDGPAFRDRLASHGYRVAQEAHDKHMLRLELAALVEGGDVPVAIEVREEPELRLAALTRQLHQNDVANGIDAMARMVQLWLRERHVEASGPATAVFRGGDRKHWHIVEAGWPIASGVQGDDHVSLHTYPAGTAATYDYRGDLTELHTFAQRFIATVLGQGLQISQPIRIQFLADEHAVLVWPLLGTA
jgi:DNA-binding transcriptional MerR regulator